MAETLFNIIHQEVLHLVQKPSRYLGSEHNSIHKDPNSVTVRLALAFPDLYDIGLGNLGLHILYAILNKLDYCWTERVYAPDIDLEEILRARGLPLFSLESKTPISELDGIGFTLQSELTYTNILNMLELSGIPLRTADRAESDPLTFCGGPAVFNPEPLVYFMDFFVFGDGEDIVIEIAEVLRLHKTRSARLLALSQIEGIYVPVLYPTEVVPNGEIHPLRTHPKIRKRITKDLNAATFPVEYIVPYTQQVHDRISLEVLRGCTQGCRFCQAGMTTRPVRERSIDNIEDLMDRTLKATGYEEVSLVSLSTCDHSQVRNMVQRVVEKATPERVSISLPSLRLDSFSVELADMVAGIRRSGLTFAPEAASPRLRAVINKWIPDEELLQMSAQAYKLGWGHVKLYFMIGLPTERDDDVEAIADLTIRTVEQGKQFNPKAKVNTGVSTFVPKPFTPFQWAAQISPEETRRRQRILSEHFYKNSSIKFGRHAPDETFLEGLVSRADRRAGDLLERAFQLGCRFDAWDEHRNMKQWHQAIEDVEFDVEHQFRERNLDEPLPWDHIDILIPKKWFQEDWQRAVELKHAEDCRHSKCHRCGVIDQERDLCAHMLRRSIEGRKIEKDFVRSPNPYIKPSENIGKPPVWIDDSQIVQRLVFRISMTGSAAFLGHLETMNAWIRALRRAGFPVAYSKGFHPHPKIAFDSARPLGEQSIASYIDIQLTEVLDSHEALSRLKAVCADGVDVLSVKEIPLRSPSLMGQIEAMEYVIYTRLEGSVLADRIQDLVATEEALIKRKVKKKFRGRKIRNAHVRSINAKEYIEDLSMSVPEGFEAEDGWSAFSAKLNRVGERGFRTSELLTLLGIEKKDTLVLRLRTRFRDEGMQQMEQESNPQYTEHSIQQ
jgi:radical SAM family uncharacterized protein/radical SAM-linked protein